MTGDLKYDDLRVILASSLPSSVPSDFLGFLPVDGKEVRDYQGPNHYFLIVIIFLINHVLTIIWYFVR
jgi:hypothetical protein